MHRHLSCGASQIAELMAATRHQHRAMPAPEARPDVMLLLNGMGRRPRPVARTAEPAPDEADGRRRIG